MRTLTLILLTLSAGLTAAPPGVGEVAPDFALPNLEGKVRRLSEVTGKGPVVLVVLRGFPGYQCPLCNRQVADLVKNGDAFSRAGARVLMVYPGPKAVAEVKAGEFVTDKKLPQHFELVVDADYAVVNSYGLRWEAAGETAYPSTFVLGRDGRIRFAKISNSHGGRTTAAEVLAELAKP